MSKNPMEEMPQAGKLPEKNKEKELNKIFQNGNRVIFKEKIVQGKNVLFIPGDTGVIVDVFYENRGEKPDYYRYEVMKIVDNVAQVDERVWVKGYCIEDAE